MEATLEPLEGNKVRLSVSVGETELEAAINDAFRRIAREVRIPGFRPGKAPRKVLEARIGPGVAREEALREALPDYYARALRDHEVDAIAPPEIDITDGQEAGDLAFDAVVEVRPEITLDGYDALSVTITSPDPTDDEVQSQIDRLREPQAELSTVERTARDGDQVLVDITGTQEGEELSGLTADDYLYELGSVAIVPEIDDNLRGAKAGDILEFSAEHPDPDEASLEFRVLVKEVQEKVLPEVTDEWAQEASEFDTADELRADIEKRIRTIKSAQAQMALRSRTSEQLAELVGDELPEAMVASEVQARLQDFAMRLSAQGVDAQQWLDASGTSAEQLMEEMREAAVQAIKVDLALRAIADSESLSASDEDVDDEVAAIARTIEGDAAELREELEQNGQMPAVRSDVRKRKALDWVLERVQITDDDGNPVERDALELPESDDESEDEPEADDEPEEKDEGEQA
jgi:trigger factor